MRGYGVPKFGYSKEKTLAPIVLRLMGGTVSRHADEDHREKEGV